MWMYVCMELARRLPRACLRVEVDVMDDDSVGARQVQALPARTRGQQERKHVIRVVEPTPANMTAPLPGWERKPPGRRRAPPTRGLPLCHAPVDRGQALVDSGGAVEAHVGQAQLVHEPLHDVQQRRPLAEDQRPRAGGLQTRCDKRSRRRRRRRRRLSAGVPSCGAERARGRAGGQQAGAP